MKPKFEDQLKAHVGNLLYCIEHGQGDTLDFEDGELITVLVKRGLKGIRKEDFTQPMIESIGMCYHTEEDLTKYATVDMNGVEI